MRDSFIFYASFAQAANMLGDKARLKLYDSVVKLGLCCAKNVTELEQVCNEIETELAQNRNVFAQFLLIKPQIISNFKRYFNGSKGAEFGHLGGAPKENKNATKNNPKTTPNDNVNVNDNVNDNVNINIEKKENKDFEEFWSIYPKQRAGSKDKALKAYLQVIKSKKSNVKQLLNAVKAYAQSDEVKRGYAKGCAAWLHDDRFLSDYGVHNTDKSDEQKLIDENGEIDFNAVAWNNVLEETWSYDEYLTYCSKVGIEPRNLEDGKQQ
jgi:hypothetical protein